MNSRRHEAGECWWRTETGQGLGARKQECGRAGGGARAVLRGTLLWPQVAAGPVGAARCIFSHRTRFPQAPCPHVPETPGWARPETLGHPPHIHTAPLDGEGFWGVASAAPFSLPPSSPGWTGPPRPGIVCQAGMKKLRPDRFEGETPATSSQIALMASPTPPSLFAVE